MAGVKGRSGRRSEFREFDRNHTLLKAWRLIDRLLDGPERKKLTVRQEAALKLCSRHIPQEVSGNFKTEVNQLNPITLDEKPLDFNVGSSNRIAALDADSNGAHTPDVDSRSAS